MIQNIMSWVKATIEVVFMTVLIAAVSFLIASVFFTEYL